jgi:hypothetical protein
LTDDHFRERRIDENEEDESNQLFCPLCAQKFGYSFGLVNILNSRKIGKVRLGCVILGKVRLAWIGLG